MGQIPYLARRWRASIDTPYGLTTSSNCLESSLAFAHTGFWTSATFPGVRASTLRIVWDGSAYSTCVESSDRTNFARLSFLGISDCLIEFSMAFRKSMGPTNLARLSFLHITNGLLSSVTACQGQQQSSYLSWHWRANLYRSDGLASTLEVPLVLSIS